MLTTIRSHTAIHFATMPVITGKIKTATMRKEDDTGNKKDERFCPPYRNALVMKNSDSISLSDTRSEKLQARRQNWVGAGRMVNRIVLLAIDL